MKRALRILSLILVLGCALGLMQPVASADTTTKLYYSTGEWKGDQMGKLTQTLQEMIRSKGTIQFYNAGSYSGVCDSDGHPDGSGTYTFYSGKTKTGTFAWVEKKNYVMEKSLSGSFPHYSGTDMRYTGMTLNGEPYGYGELDFMDGGTFYGEFKDGAVDGRGIYVYLEPNYLESVSGYSWKMVSRTSSSLGGRWYSGLTLNGKWEGFGMLCYDYSYYVGEVYQQYCSGHGAYWRWNQQGEPSGTLTETKCGHYRSGSLQYTCSHASKFAESFFAPKIASSGGSVDGQSGATY